MTTSPRTRITAILATGLIAAALVPATQAVASPAPGTGSTDGTAQRLTKDPAAAEPFVAQVGPELAQPAAIADDGFQWGDALIGAGVTLAGIAIALAAAGTVRTGRKRYPATAQSG